MVIAFLSSVQMRQTGATEFGVDGSYYFQVARHVADGEGLLTSVCLYHQGLKRLPSKTNIYPLWPLLLGAVGRRTDLIAAAHWLPQLLAAIALVLLYVLTIAIARERQIAAADWPFDVGHIAVLVLASNPIFFAASTVPYTESLSFVMLFGALVAVGRDGNRGTLAGAFAALAFLTRSQMIVVAPSIVVALLIRRRIASAIAACVAFIIVIAPWIVFLATFVRPFTPMAVLSMYHETTALPAYPLTVIPHGMAEYLSDRVRGLLVAFDPTSALSFVASFGVIALFVPVACVHWLIRTGFGRLASGIGPRTLATALAGALLSGMLIFVHQRFFLEWLFGYRHGLPFILLIALAMIELMDSTSVVRKATLTVVAISILTCVITAIRQAPPPHAWPPARDAQLAAWLAHNGANGIVLSTNAQVLSAISRANFRWAACDDAPSTTRAMLRLVRTDYVAAYDGEQRCSFLDGLVGRDLRVIAVFGQWPQRLFLMRPIPISSAPPSAPGD